MKERVPHTRTHAKEQPLTLAERRRQNYTLTAYDLAEPKLRASMDKAIDEHRVPEIDAKTHVLATAALQLSESTGRDREFAVDEIRRLKETADKHPHHANIITTLSMTWEARQRPPQT